MKTGRKLLAICLVMTVLFSGCSFSKTEIKNRLIIQAVGIDAPSEGRVRLTLQFLNTELAGNPNSGGERGKTVRCMTVEDASVSEAMEQVKLLFGKLPMLSQNRILVFGWDTAKRGVYPYVDYFIRNAESRATVQTAISATTAEELVSLQMGDNILAAGSIEDVLQFAQFDSPVFAQELYQFVNKLKAHTVHAVLPILEPEKVSEEMRVRFTGLGVFKEGRLCSVCEGSDLLAYSLLNKNSCGGQITVPMDASSVSDRLTLRIQKSTVRIRPKITAQGVCFQIHLDLKADVLENEKSEPNVLTEDFLSKTEEIADAFVGQLLLDSVNRYAQEEQLDLYYFGARLHRRYPKFYREQVGDWFSYLPNVHFAVQVQVHIQRIGNSIELG